MSGLPWIEGGRGEVPQESDYARKSLCSIGLYLFHCLYLLYLLQVAPHRSLRGAIYQNPLESALSMLHVLDATVK